ncbi:hypothetical protein ONZ45_g1254 [Pleurotus djamor]|nr:hypothetical protein ONZ45_g1254 [Pleurotus djamor]
MFDTERLVDTVLAILSQGWPQYITLLLDIHKLHNADRVVGPYDLDSLRRAEDLQHNAITGSFSLMDIDPDGDIAQRTRTALTTLAVQANLGHIVKSLVANPALEKISPIELGRDLDQAKLSATAWLYTIDLINDSDSGIGAKWIQKVMEPLVRLVVSLIENEDHLDFSDDQVCFTTEPLPRVLQSVQSPQANARMTQGPVHGGYKVTKQQRAAEAQRLWRRRAQNNQNYNNSLHQ